MYINMFLLECISEYINRNITVMYIIKFVNMLPFRLYKGYIYMPEPTIAKFYDVTSVTLRFPRLYVSFMSS